MLPPFEIILKDITYYMKMYVVHPPEQFLHISSFKLAAVIRGAVNFIQLNFRFPISQEICEEL